MESDFASYLEKLSKLRQSQGLESGSSSDDLDSMLKPYRTPGFQNLSRHEEDDHMEDGIYMDTDEESFQMDAETLWILRETEKEVGQVSFVPGTVHYDAADRNGDDKVSIPDTVLITYGKTTKEYSSVDLKSMKSSLPKSPKGRCNLF
jgi:hypothetical protein